MKNRSFLYIMAAAIFAASFILAFGSSAIAAAIAAYSKSEPATVEPIEFPRLSDNLRDQLSAAATPDYPFGFDSAANPFADQTGVGGAIKNTPVGSGLTTVAPVASPNLVAKLPPSANTSTLPAPGFTPNNQAENQLPAGDKNDVLTAYSEREQNRLRGNTVGEAASIYGVDDVKPVGTIGSKCRNNPNKSCHEIIFYSPVTKETFIAPAGTRFRDGQIVAVEDEGITFRRDNNTVQKSKWARKTGDQKKADSLINTISPAPAAAPVQTARNQ